MTTGERRTALVFGGARGIGAAAVERLVKDGFDTAFTYVSRPDSANELVAKLQAAGGRAAAIEADSGDPSAIRAAVAKTVDLFGPLDAVVVNAGILRLNTVEDVSLEELDQMLDINVRGVFLSIQAAVLHIRDGGRIITIGSNVAISTGHRGSSVYQFTKTAVAAMVKGIALDLAPRRITVNNIQPGPTNTDMTSDLVAMLSEKSPLKRVADPAEIAGVVAYLASPASSYMTGSSLTIDGGLTL
ncbi:SDR family oxidoreductase [Rhizobium sp. RM]|uniref:SDR family NAD(P)-dependent oxidoreductase n=1 Tax=Rhizobium sp. RM TaxID=2748079 RepID=UPI00110EAA06|nr:SDR family oxidoreductase [Rhizobium sp. RM]NWJ25979.1 SDR family oxidoreductase [Rhizobium sp. RM]TMV20591.1 SDR family oxidoreductase [Rhizobium sp. Td3]